MVRVIIKHFYALLPNLLRNVGKRPKGRKRSY